MSASRLARARERLRSVDVDAFLVSRPANRRWLTGVSAEDASQSAHAGWVYVDRHRAALVTSSLYHGAAVAEARDCEVVLATARIHETFAELIRSSGARRVGFDRGWFTFQNRDDLASALHDWAELVPVDDPIEPLRVVKDSSELAAIRTAVALSDAAMEAAYGEVKPGITERDLAWFFEAYMRTRGSEGLAFEAGVASGPNAAVPHHKPSDRKLGRGDPVWIDIGARIDGYCSDITRSFAVGRASDEYRARWQIVADAQRAAFDVIRPGATGRECDLAARGFLNRAGYGDAFGHSLGHGVGLVIHEAPRLSRWSDDRLEPGMIVTVEPGIYLEDWGGIRHEEYAVITPSGCEILTTASRPLEI